jgi:hypothetical protein
MTILKSIFKDPSSIKRTVFFNESPEKEVFSFTVINSSSIDTTLIDAFRQGVELTSIKHFDAGTIKIHAGEDGHELRTNKVGMDRTYQGPSFFQELDYFNPVDFLIAQDKESTLYFSLMTFPIITGDNDQIENYSFDGVIEPFSIRPKISFFSIDHPFESHDVRGTIMAGNVNTKQGAALIDNKYENLAVGMSPYNDMIEMFAGKFSLCAYQGESPLVQPTPFNDNFCSSYRNSSDAEMSDILSKMNSDNETTNNNCRNEIVISSGFTYNTIGIDSLAFGGMAY